jgi:hypothetical protein
LANKSEIDLLEYIEGRVVADISKLTDHAINEPG